jgi:hypothetical protein
MRCADYGRAASSLRQLFWSSDELADAPGFGDADANCSGHPMSCEVSTPASGLGGPGDQARVTSGTICVTWDVLTITTLTTCSNGGSPLCRM